MNASTEFRTTVRAPSETIWSTFVTTSEVVRNVSAPKCSIRPQDCSILQSAYNSSSNAYESAVSNSVTPRPPYPTEPICGSATLPGPTTLIPPACIYNHATIQLL